MKQRPTLVFLLFASLLLSCGNKTSVELCKYADDILTADGPTKPGAVVIPYRISYSVYGSTDALSEPKVICTPKLIKEKVKKVFELYESIPQANLQFRYAGQFENIYQNFTDIPQDGSIYIVFRDITNSAVFQALGAGNTFGGIPSAYKGGFAVFNTKSSTTSLEYRILVHEIGHALGLNHIPAAGSQMSYEGAPWPTDENVYSEGEQYRYEYLAFTEQDQADLIALWPAAGAKHYTISGTVETDLASTKQTRDEGGRVMVHAVSTVNGRTYSTLGIDSGATITFSINLLTPGSYRVFTKPITYISDWDPTGKCPSWYIGNSSSTNDPTGGTVLTVSDASPTISGINVVLLSQAAPFNFSGRNVNMLPFLSDFNPTFLAPGETGIFAYTNTGGSALKIANTEAITSIESYGTSPDYSFPKLQLISGSHSDSTYITDYYQVTVAANVDATTGHRLALARSSSGTIQAGLIGVHILSNSRKPDFLKMTIWDQLAGNYDFPSLNPSYWK